MAQFIGLSVPDEIEEKVHRLAQKHPMVQPRPYVTLLSAQLLEGVLGIHQKMQTFCLLQTEFRVAIGGPNCYKNQQLYLTVLPGAVNFTREKFIQFLGISPEGGVYRPHATIVRQPADSPLDLQPLLQDARELFAKPYPFLVESLNLYERDEGGAVRTVATIPLTGR